MYIKSNQKTQDFLKLKNYKENLIGINHDQAYINKNKINLTAMLLPMIFQTLLIIINIVQNLIHI